MIPCGDACNKKFYWCTPASTFFSEKPFGKHIGGLSQFGAQAYVSGPAVEAEDVVALPLCGTFCGKPLL